MTPLEEKDREKLKRKLRSEEKKIEGQLSRYKGGLDFGDDTDHGEEETDETEEFGTWLGLKQVFEHQLERIRRALSKLKRGDYGRCERCGKEIEKKLLEIDPESALCISCKKKRKA